MDPELKDHLSTFGINVMSQTKTEKSMTELVSSTSLSLSFSPSD
jgi:ubiquitin carboxyl-terminal hydrolase 5/13